MTTIPYKSIQIGDKPIFEHYLSQAGKLCADYAFANLFAWSAAYDTQWLEFENFLVIRFRIIGSEKIAYLEPLGSGDISKVLEFIRQDAKSLGEPLRFFSLSREFADRVQRLPNFRFLRFYPNRAFGNYIYPRAQMETLAGKKLHSKRNHIAQFQKLYPEHRFKTISPAEDSETLAALIDKWLHTHEKRTTTILEEKAMMEKAIAHYDELGLFGILLFVGDSPAAFSFGSQITEDTFCVHVEKADVSYEGAYAMIGKLMAESLPKNILHINREEDMGIPSLRKAKLSYHPETITEEFFACDANSVEADIRTLWQKSFPSDDDEFKDAFLYPYSNAKTRQTLYQNGTLASMLHLFEMKSDWGNVDYIYGLATDEASQGKGFASRLIRDALHRAKDDGAILVWTIPANGNFHGWQKLDFGEKQSEPLRFETDDGFSFGENPETDFGIFRIVDMHAYLKLFAEAHPDFRSEIFIEDGEFSENTGTYAISLGKVEYVKSSDSKGLPHKTPVEIPHDFPLPDGKRLVLSVVPGQR